MIYSLSGILIEKGAGDAVIECAGVGYHVFVPLATAAALPSVGAKCTVFTYMNISENLIQLFGFADKESQNMFKILITVSGVGPKAGLAIISALSCDKIVLAIQAGDFKAFTSAQGVGPKLAQRIVLELKDKVGKSLFGEAGNYTEIGSAVQSSGVGQAIAALCSLGYTQSEAAQCVSTLDSALPVQELIRLALQGIGKRK